MPTHTPLSLLPGTMCTGIHDRYLDCEKGHSVEIFHYCLKALEYILNIKPGGCPRSRTIYCTMTGTCPKCEYGSDFFDSASESMSEDGMDISDDAGEPMDEGWDSPPTPKSENTCEMELQELSKKEVVHRK